MTTSKIQIFFASTVNLITAIISSMFLFDTSHLLKEQGLYIFNYCPIWISIAFLTLFTIYFAIYFYLMLFHYFLCTFVTNNENIGGPNFSICGCCFLLFGLGSYVYNLQLFSTNNFCTEVSNNSLFKYSIYSNILNPVVIMFGILIIKFINNCFCKEGKKIDSNLDYHRISNV